MYAKGPTAASPPAPSAPPLSPASGHYDPSSVDVYALPLARPVPFSPPPLPPPPPPQSIRHHPSTNAGVNRHTLRVHTEQDCCPSVWPALWFAAHLAVYHVANAALACAAAAVVWLGLALSLAMLPLCGFGVVVFNVTVRTAFYLSEFDAKFHNTITTADDEIITFPDDDERRPLLPLYDPARPTTATASQVPRPRFARDELSRLSPRALLLFVYFGVVKLLIGFLGALDFAFVITFSAALVVDKASVHLEVDGGLTLNNSEWTPVANVVAAVVCAVGLHVLARVSQAATRFFCCERR